MRSLLCGCQRINDVRHRHRRAVLRMRHAKSLELHLAAELLKMFGQQLLLGLHAGRAAGPRPDRAELLQILVGPGSVEGDIFQLQGGARRRRAAVLAKKNPGSHRRSAEHHDRRHRHGASRNKTPEKTRLLGHGSLFAGRRRERSIILLAGRNETFSRRRYGDGAAAHARPRWPTFRRPPNMPLLAANSITLLTPPLARLEPHHGFSSRFLTLPQIPRIAILPLRSRCLRKGRSTKGDDQWQSMSERFSNCTKPPWPSGTRMRSTTRTRGSCTSSAFSISRTSACGIRKTSPAARR